MELQISGKEVEVSAELRSYIERKIGKLDRHLPNIVAAEVELGKEMTRSPQHRYVVQVTLNCDGTLLRGEERGADLYAAIDSVAQVMDRQVERYKGRLYEKGRGKAPAPDKGPALPAEPSGRVVRVKSFAVKPMSPAEAVEQMELLGHQFFVFFNQESNRFGVLYRRGDGDYGLIDPELA